MTTPDLIQPPIHLKFDDASLLATLFGDHDRNLVRLEQKLDVAITWRGDLVSIDGVIGNANAAKRAIEGLATRIGRAGRRAESQEKGKNQREGLFIHDYLFPFEAQQGSSWMLFGTGRVFSLRARYGKITRKCAK